MSISKEYLENSSFGIASYESPAKGEIMKKFTPLKSEEEEDVSEEDVSTEYSGENPYPGDARYTGGNFTLPDHHNTDYKQDQSVII